MIFYAIREMSNVLSGAQVPAVVKVEESGELREQTAAHGTVSERDYY